jgi:hypothetical protein
MIENYFTGILILIFIFKLRRDFLCFTFLSLFFFLFVVIPVLIIETNHETSQQAIVALEESFIFLICFSCTYMLATFKEKSDSASFYFHNSEELNFITNNSIYLIYIGILIKIVGGDVIHSSIYYIPWQFPFLYGISDRIYYLGVLLICVSIYKFGFSFKNGFAVVLVILLGVLGGSRVTILIPLSFFILYKFSTGKLIPVFFLSIFSVVGLFLIIVLIGMYRIGPEDRGFTFDMLWDTFIFRISEFMWPVALIEKLNSSQIEFNFGWLFSGFLGMLPAFIGEYLTGQSVFARDTILMLNSGIGNEYMSVPLTPIGEGYYWGGSFGVAFISSLYAVGFVFLYRLTKKLNLTTRALLYLQLFRSSFALPVAAFPEFISFLTKDILIDLLVVYIFTKFFNLIRIKKYRSNKI